MCQTGEEYLPNQMGWAKMSLALVAPSAVHALRAKEMERQLSSVRTDGEAAVGVGWAGYSLSCSRAAAPCQAGWRPCNR